MTVRRHEFCFLETNGEEIVPQHLCHFLDAEPGGVAEGSTPGVATPVGLTPTGADPVAAPSGPVPVPVGSLDVTAPSPVPASSPQANTARETKT
jgi:hypothetical protein